MIVDLDLTILDASDAFLKSTFTWRDEIRGCRMFDAFPDNPYVEDADGECNLRSSFERVLRERRSQRMANQRHDVRDRDGAWLERHWSPTLSPLFAAPGGHVSRVAFELRDITRAVLLDAWIGEQLLVVDEQCETLERMRQDVVLRSARLHDAGTQARAILQQPVLDRGHLEELCRALGAPDTQTHWQAGSLATVSGQYRVLHGPSCRRASGQSLMRAGWVFSDCMWCGSTLEYRLIRRVRDL